MILTDNKEKLLLKPLTENEFVACIIQKPDSFQILSDVRLIFRDTLDFHMMFQSNGSATWIHSYLISKQEINSNWKSRIVKYKIIGQNSPGYYAFTIVEMYIGDNGLIQLKIAYNSSPYIYNMKIETNNELTFCGFGESGGETVSFTKNKKSEIMTLFGLILKKD